VADFKAGIDLPKKSLTYIGLGVIGILVLIFLGIFPAKNSLANLDMRAAEVKYRIEEQKALAPFYKSLKERTDKQEMQFLPLPQKASLPHAKMSTIPAMFTDAAKKSGLTLLAALPQLSAVGGASRVLPMDIVLRGSFFNFRKFLIAIGGIPYVQHVEEISIQEVPGAREFKLKILVAVG
jgi:Tfp pilus assembly protein PilO